MKPTILKTFSALLILSVMALSSCKKDKCVQTVTYKKYVPIYMSYADMRDSVKSGPAQPLKNPGKIYIKGNYIFVNEQNAGIHIIDNSNPSSPQNIAFINIPGNMDLAATGNTLYADCYVDLLCIDISNPASIKVMNTVQNALPYPTYTNGYNADPTLGVVKEWQQKTVTEQVNTNCNTNQQVYPVMYNTYNTTGGGIMTAGANTSGTSVNINQNVPGIGGSTARFTIASNTLYIVDNSTLHVYNITNNISPQKAADQNLGWWIQTIFPYKNHLFIGSSDGFYIYDITNPLSPSQVSVYSHITACDPVVVDDQYAYFTLSNDAPCHMGFNQLEVVDITDPANPTLKVTMPMTDPKGLGIDSKTLFICDTNNGLVVYEASGDVTQIASKQIAHFSNINAFDVIPYNKHLVMIGSDGLYQYDYSNVQNITLLSKMAVQN